MAKQVLNNGETHGSIRGKINDNFTELYNDQASHKAENVTDSDGAHGLKVESGTWTPELFGSVTAGAPTYASQVGQYYRIGDLIRLTFVITITSKGGMAGNIRIKNLPFVSSGSGVGNIQAYYNQSSPADSKVDAYIASNEMPLTKDNGAYSITDADLLDNFAINLGEIIYKIA